MQLIPTCQEWDDSGSSKRSKFWKLKTKKNDQIIVCVLRRNQRRMVASLHVKYCKRKHPIVRNVPLRARKGSIKCAGHYKTCLIRRRTSRTTANECFPAKEVSCSLVDAVLYMRLEHWKAGYVVVEFFVLLPPEILETCDLPEANKRSCKA